MKRGGMGARPTRAEPSEVHNDEIMLTGNITLKHNKVYCKELGFHGVESCDFKDCGYRARCQVARE